MISAHIDQQTSFASHNSLLSAAISRDISSENDMTDEESTVMSSVHMKTMNSEHSTPFSVDSSASRINPLSRHKSRTSCDGDIDDTDSEISPAGSFFNEICNPSTSCSDETTDGTMPITIPRPTEGESPLDGLFLICEALERPARRSGSTGTDRSSEISSPANSPLSGSPTQLPSLISLRDTQPPLLSTGKRGGYIDCNYQLIDNTPATPLMDAYQQYSHHHIHHHHDMHQQQDIIIQPNNKSSHWVAKETTPSNRIVQNGDKSNNSDKQSNTNSLNSASKHDSNDGNVSHFPLSTLFTAAEALLPGTSDNKGSTGIHLGISGASNMKPSRRAYTKRADKLGNKSAATSNLGVSAATVGKKSNAGRKPKNVSEKTPTEKDIESKKRKREADKSLSSKKRYDASEKLAVVVEKLRKYFAMELHKL